MSNDNTRRLQVVAPKGYEIDREKSTIDNIIFKKVVTHDFRGWHDKPEIRGWQLDMYGNMGSIYRKDRTEISWGVFTTKELAQAVTSLAKLSQQMLDVNRDWEPDWDDGTPKYCITSDANFLRGFTVRYFAVTKHFLAFETEENAVKFMNKNTDDISEAIKFSI